MIGMLVLGGGWWVAFDGCCPKNCGADGPLLELGMFANGSVESALAWGHFSVLARHCEGSGGSHQCWGLFSVATRWRKRSEGSALALGPQFWFGSRSPQRVQKARARLCLVEIYEGYVLGHGTFVALPTIMWWGTVGSVLGSRFNINSLD